MRKGRDGEENGMENGMENKGENNGPLTSLPVGDRLQRRPLVPIFLVVFHLYNELRHTHKQEMELRTCVCTSFYFCHLFTDPF